MPAGTRGFTLIEILCTVSILAIAALSASPFLSGNAQAKLSAVARSTISDLFYAQNLAITTQQPVFVLFSTADNTSGGGYRLLTQTSATSYKIIERPGGGPFVVNFGQIAAGSVGSQMPDGQIKAVKQGGTAITPLSGNSITYATTTWANQTGVMLGFDTTGQPVVGNDAASTAGKLSATGSIDLAASSSGAVLFTLNLEPLSGEITIN